MIPTPTLALAGVLAALGIAAGGFYAGSEWTQGKQAKKDVIALKALNEEIERLRTKERQHVEDTAKAATDHAAKVKAIRKEYDAENAALRDGTLRLRVPVTNCTPSETSTPASGSASGATAELHPKTASALFGLANECDEVVLQLQLLQTIAKDDRKDSP